MGRWEPNARGRLARAALELSAERGYEQTTVADIARTVGVTERTFYRYFPDKADALFPDNSELLVHLSAITRDASRGGASPLQAARTAVDGLIQLVSQEPDRVRLTITILPQSPALLGRDLVRHQRISEAIAAGLIEDQVAETVATVAAELATTMWKVALTQWARDQDARSLSDVYQATMDAALGLGSGSPL